MCVVKWMGVIYLLWYNYVRVLCILFWIDLDIVFVSRIFDNFVCCYKIIRLFLKIYIVMYIYIDCFGVDVKCYDLLN